MILPTNATNVGLATPSGVSTPAPGNVTYFFNTLDVNKLYYKDEYGQIFLADSSDSADCCACTAMTKIISDVGCALNKGLMTAAEYTTFISTPIQIQAVESVDSVTGARTCTVSLNPAS